MKHVASGIFTWDRYERVSNRYGSFNFDGTAYFDLERIAALVGKRVCITCKVMKARKSEHIGDLFLGVFPSTPSVGEIVMLGVGTLQLEASETRMPNIVLEPGARRNELWIDPDKLYRLHDQTVEVTIEPTTAPFTKLDRKWKHEKEDQG